MFINDRDSGENEIEVYLKQFSVYDARIGEDLKRGLMNIKIIYQNVNPIYLIMINTCLKTIFITMIC